MTDKDIVAEISAIKGCLELLIPLLPSARSRAIEFVQSKILEINKTPQERLKEAKAKAFRLERELAECNGIIGGLSDEVA